ncbi:GAF domain-containing protein [Candidatus Poribacteria bacterium]|nr:GAF domain-containing protein [Candidatus Poribacteria bacterium]
MNKSSKEKHNNTVSHKNKIDKNIDNKKRMNELAALHKISKSMHTLNLNEILYLILDGVTNTIGFDRTRLYLINEDKSKLECKMAVGIEKEKIEGINVSLDKENSMLARAIIEQKPFIIEDAVNDPRVNKDLKKLFGLKSFAVVPLIGKDKVLGAVTADNLSSNRTITKDEFESLITFSYQAGLALENAKMYDELKSFNQQLEDRVRIATENLKKAQDRLIQSEKLATLGKLSASIAHEIRNPLTSIKILIHSLKEKNENPITRENDIKVIENEIERMNRIINKFLEFARPKEPEFSSCDINQILEETIKLISCEAKEKNICLVVDLPHIPFIYADKEQMKQVFLNLILNSFQAMPDKGVLTISSEASDKNIIISIADTGCGIQEKNLSKIFEPFFTTRQDGIGLGLSVVQRIIDSHNGKIEVKPVYPKGTMFIIKLDSSLCSE